ncbi:MAG TPA: hypothetical protein VIV34_12690 [Pseudolabrys sp.]
MLRFSALATAAVLFAPIAHAADLHTCRLSDDKRSVTVLVSNPYAQETSCTVNCHIRFPGEGIRIDSISCTKTVPAGAKDFELCSRTRDNGGVYVRLDDPGNSECIKPLAEQNDEKDDDDDKMDEHVRKLSEDMLKMLKKK